MHEYLSYFLINCLDACQTQALIYNKQKMEEPKHNLDLMSINNRFGMDPSQLLGAGGYGKVFKGYDNTQKKIIAVKNVNKAAYMQWKDLTEREITVMQKLKHPNIIQFYDSFVDSSDGMFMFIELCQKQNLRKRNMEGLREEEALEWFRQLVEGMFYMNSQSIFHRDLKPENLLISQDSKTLKIADLGIARQISPDTFKTKMMCTQQYAAPEIILGRNDYNQKCDVYSAGYILYEMLTSERIVEREKKKQQKLIQFLLEKEKKGGWKIDHPAIVQKKQWITLLDSMLRFDPSKRISFAEIREYLKKLKPSNSLPLARTIANEQKEISKQEKAKIFNSIDYQLQKLSSVVNVVRILGQIDKVPLGWMPSIYKLMVAYQCSILYCKKNEELGQNISRRDVVNVFGMNTFREIQHKLIRQDRAEVTKYLDEITIRLNSQKENIKNFASIFLASKVDQILKEKSFDVQKKLMKQVPEFLKMHQLFSSKSEYIKNISFQNGIKFLVDILYQTGSSLQGMCQLELRLYYLLLNVKKVDMNEEFSWGIEEKSVKKISFLELRQMTKRQLLEEIKVLGREGGNPFKKK